MNAQKTYTEAEFQTLQGKLSAAQTALERVRNLIDNQEGCEAAIAIIDEAMA
jgi:spore germination cell wall hydrolase CwlJ-like protein